MIATVLAYLVDAAWQVPLLAAGALALARFGGLGPRGRNLVWLVCLVCAVVLPAAHFPQVTTLTSPAVPASPETIAQVMAVAPPTAETLPRPFELDVDGGWALAIAAAFAMVVFVGLVRVVGGSLTVGRLVRRAVAAPLPARVAAELEAVAVAHGAHSPEFRQTAEIPSPVVAGVVRPVIVAPHGFVERPEPEVRAALMHELAHVLRRDYAVNLLCELVSLPVCWHPATHLIKAEIRRTRELACDAMASAAMHSERAYAESLVALARSYETTPAPDASAAFVGLFGKPSLEERLMHLIGPKRPSRPALKTLGLLSGGAVAAGAVSAAVLLHVPTALAQSTPPAPPAPPPSIYATPEAPPAPPASPAMYSTPEAPPAPPAPPAVPAVDAALAEPATLPTPAVAPTPPTPPEAEVVMNEGKGGYEHRWVSRSGKHITIMTDDAREPTPEERAHYEATIGEAMKKARKAMDLASSAEFKAQLAMLKSKDFEAKAKLAALKALDDPAIKAQIAEAQRVANSDLVLRAKAEALRVMDDPKIKAEIAEAERVGRSDEFRLKAQAEALKALDDPKVKAEIERAQRLSRSPELRKAARDMRDAAERLRRAEEESDAN